MSDIISGAGDVILGPNWLPSEFVGEVFRWVTNDATAYVPAVEPIEHCVTVDLEAGYSIDRSRPFALDVFGDDDVLLANALVSGRQTLVFYLPAGPPKLHKVRLHVENTNTPAAVHDPRVLNFRVFSIRAEPLRPDVVSAVTGFRVGRGGWYFLEEAGDDVFRWVNNDAEIVVTSGRAKSLELEVEPGPGVGSGPLELTILDPRGDELVNAAVGSRRRMTLDLPESHESPYSITLHAQNGGAVLPGQPRILNFRVFHIPPA